MFAAISAYDRRIAAFLHDMVMTAAALTACFAIRFDTTELSLWMPVLWTLLIIVLPLAAVVYWFFGLYRGVWRFASIPDLINIVKSVAVLTLGLGAIDYLSADTVIVPRSVVFTYPFIQIFLLGAPRMVYRSYRDWRTGARASTEGNGIRALVLGSGSEAELIIRALEMNPTQSMRAVGLLGHKKNHSGQRIRNVPILGGYGDIDTVLASLNRRGLGPQRIIVTREALTKGALIERALAIAEEQRIPISRIESPLQGVVESNRPLKLAPVKIEDLLGRSSHTLDYPLVRRMLSGRRVLVTGGGGSIGLELCRQVAALGASRLMVLDFGEYNLYAALNELANLAPDAKIEGQLCDVRNRERLAAAFKSFQPDLVFHAAALKHVPLMEAHLVEAAATNIIGTKNVAELTAEIGAQAMVMISTDKAVVPSSVVGATKRCAEMFCEIKDRAARTPRTGAERFSNSAATRFVSVRFGNVLGSSGSVVPLFLSQIERGGPVTVTHPEMERYFMTVNEAVGLVLMASAHGLKSHGEPISLYALDMGEPQKIMDLAERMIRLSGFEPGKDIEIKITGVRPGEKLREEVFGTDDSLHETALEGILAAEPLSLSTDRVEALIQDIAEAVDANNPTTVREAIAELVPKYREQQPVTEAAQ